MSSLYWKNNLTHYLGRNGMGKCVGVSIAPTITPIADSEKTSADGRDVTQATVTLEPINTKELCARCILNIPTSSIDMLVELLLAAKIQAESDFAHRKRSRHERGKGS